MFSYDRALKKIILRQFHAEGFGNKCVLEFVGSDGKVHEFATVRIQKYSARLEGEGKVSNHFARRDHRNVFTGGARQRLRSVLRGKPQTGKVTGLSGVNPANHEFLGPNRMRAAPARQTAAPKASQRSGRAPSTAHNQSSEDSM